MPTRPQHEHPIRQINHYGAAPTHHSHMALALIGRVRARKLRQRRWRCVTGAADRRRRDRRLCPCQLRAGELCAVRGKAPLLICSGAASRRGLPYGGSARFYGVQLGGKVIGAGLRAAAAVRGLVSSSGRLSLCFPDDEASCCGCRGPALRAARSRLTALVVSAGHVPGPVGQAGAAASFRLRNAGRRALAVLVWSGDGSPVWGCTTTSGDQVPPRTLFRIIIFSSTVLRFITPDQVQRLPIR